MLITLPITVRNSAPLGYWLTPVVADCLARQISEQTIVYYGALGKRASSSHELSLFKQNLQQLGVKARIKSDEEEAGLIDLVDSVVEKLGVTDSSQLCYVCECGSLELPVSIATYAKQKTFSREGEDYVCKACGQKGKKTHARKQSLVIPEKLDPNQVAVYPAWYAPEVKEVVRQLNAQGYTVFRDRETGINRTGRQIDVEFAWSLLPLVLSLHNRGERVRIVITNHVLRQAIAAMIIAAAINPSFQGDVIVLPCIEHPGNTAKWNLERLFQLGYTGELLRLMLISSLGWSKKDVPLLESLRDIEHRRITLLKKHIAALSAKQFELSAAIRNLNREDILLGIKRVFNPELFDYSTLMGLL